MSTTILYVTAASAEDAVAIGRVLVDERLAACANVFADTTAIYRWEGAVRQDSEAVLVLKTRADRAEAAIARVREIHAYACPCVLAIPVAGGNPDFLAWIATETQPPIEA